MKRMFVFVVVAALVLALPAVAAAADSGAKAAVEKLSADFAAAWNVHDARKMAAVWAEDGDLINPFGQKAHGRAGIETFLEKEQSTVMKGTTYKIDSMSVRDLDANTAIADWESDVVGMMDATGKAMPPFRHHVFSVCVKKGGHWHAAAVRAYAFQPLPAGPAK
jgi:uncharacterized protein (TIGR02246 family)